MDGWMVFVRLVFWGGQSANWGTKHKLEAGCPTPLLPWHGACLALCSVRPAT